MRQQEKRISSGRCIDLANKKCQRDAGCNKRFEDTLLQCPQLQSVYVNPVLHTFAKPKETADYAFS